MHQMLHLPSMSNTLHGTSYWGNVCSVIVHLQNWLFSEYVSIVHFMNWKTMYSCILVSWKQSVISPVWYYPTTVNNMFMKCRTFLFCLLFSNISFQHPLQLCTLWNGLKLNVTIDPFWSQITQSIPIYIDQKKWQANDVQNHYRKLLIYSIAAFLRLKV